MLNFEVSLLDEEGKLIQFKTGEDKIPALNFTIQIITKKMLKVKKPVYTQKKKKNILRMRQKLKLQLKISILQIKKMKKFK